MISQENLNNISREIIVFYNTENFFLPDPKPVHHLDPTTSGLRNWDTRRYQNKLHKTCHVFELLQDDYGTLPFLIGLSEIYNSQVLQELIELPPFSNQYGYVHYDSMDERGVDVALLYDKNKIKILDSETISFIFEIEDDIPDNYDTTRDVLHCKVQYKNDVFHVFVCHLPSKREKDINLPKRKHIISELYKKLESLQTNTNEAFIIIGDFNENPNEDNIKILTREQNAEVRLYNPFVQLMERKIYSTFHYKEGLLFDQILLSKHFLEKDFAVQFQDARVFNHQKLCNWNQNFRGRPFRTYAGTRYLGGYSDHFPVLVVFDQNK